LLNILKADRKGYATQLCSDELELEGYDFFDFVENNLLSLIQYTQQPYTEQFVQNCIDQYFENLDPIHLVGYEPTKELLHALGQKRPFALPDKLQLRIQCWQEIARFLALGSAAINL